MRRRWPLVLALLAAALDLGVKAWAAANLAPGSDRALLPGVLHLGFTTNTGVAWGLLGGQAGGLAILRLLVGSVVLAGLLLGRWPGPWRPPLALIAGGALGNALDGLTRGHVVDYLSSPALSAATQAVGAGAFPIFNLADVWVVAGAALLLVTARTAGVQPGPSRK